MADDQSLRRLVIVDGANSVYRAFFAIPHLRAPDGSPTNAVLGMANMLRKVIREESADLVVVAYDARGKTFRHETYPEYKAGRDATPEDLSSQLPVVRELLERLAIPLVEVEGFEADDIIATLVADAPDDMAVSIVSSDKDLMQLVSDRVVLIDGVKDVRIGPAEVEAKFGVPPEQMLDLRALVGDPSDNIPGVKGIGVKGAAKLIAEYGTLEALLDRAEEVKAKRAREALLERRAEAELSKQLSALRFDVPLPCELEELERREPDPEKLRDFYARLGFTRLVEALDAESEDGAGSVAHAPTMPVEVEIAFDLAAAEKIPAALPAGEPLAVRGVREPGSAVEARLVGLAFAVAEDRAIYLPIDDFRRGVAEQADLLGGAVSRGETPEALQPVLAEIFRPERPWLGADVKGIQSLLAERGVTPPPPTCDVEIASFLLDPAGAHGVPALSLEHLGRSLETWEELAGRGARAVAASELEVERVARWAGAQAVAMRELAPRLEARLEADGLAALMRDVEVPLTAVLSRVERAGVRIDESRLASLSEQYESDLARIEAEIYELAGEKFLVNSPKQLQVILFDKLKLEPLKKTKTGYSTAEGVLEQLALQHPLPERILAWRKLSKLKSTYIDALPKLVSERTGRIHPTFNQTGAATGRLSATDPNVQNIPIRTEEGVRIREAFIPAEGRRLVSADYSQVELRILAHYSGDESLIDAFTRGDDIHRRTAAEVAGISTDAVTDDQRARAKAVNFGIIYGSSAFGLANNLGIATGEAQETIDAYFERYQGVRRFLDESLEGARERGYAVTLLGRRRYLPDLASRNRTLRQAAERMAVNSVIQGTAADLIKRAMIDVDAALREEGLGAQMILQVHDELVFDVPTAEIDAIASMARRCMEDVFALRVPLVVDVGTGHNWREAH